MKRISWNTAPSTFASNTHNEIRNIVENLDLEPNPEKEFISLSLGDPTVFGNLKPHPEIIEAVKRSAESYKYNGYTNCIGYLEAREAVAQYSSSEALTIDPEDVLLCSGCSGALDICITGIASPGQNIIIPRPGFCLYRTQAEGLGIKVKTYDLKPEKGWEVDLRQLESQIDDKTAAIVVNNPSNPCGSVYSENHLREILAVARRNFVPIIADEIYEHVVFPGEKFYPLASLSDDVPILSCSGLTKRFLVPGWRMGWIIVHDRNNILKEVKRGLVKLCQRIIGSSTIIQGALPSILSKTPQYFFDDTVQLLQRHAKLAHSLLSAVNGLHPIMPQGAMYMMVKIDMAQFPKFKSTLDFAKQMVTEESVFCLPGECFGCSNYVRLVLTVPENMLLEACKRITVFCERNYKKEIIKQKVSYMDEYKKFNKYVIPMEEPLRTNSP